MSAFKGDWTFVHIPKNAGTSIRRALNWKSIDDLDRKVRTERDPALANHFPIYRIEELRPVKHSFMVVRNPFDRLVSLYRHRMRKLHLSYEGKPRNTKEDIECAERGFNHWLLNTPSRMDSVLTRMPQAQWGVGSSGYMVSHVLRFENLDEDWPWICGLIHENCALPKMNVGKAHDYRRVFSKEAREHVEDFFKEDLDRYAYSF